MTDKRNNKKFRKILSFFLRIRTLPEIILILTIILGVSISILVKKQPDTAYLYVIGLSIIATSAILFLVIIDKQSYVIRTSEAVGIKNYPYITLWSAIEWEIFDAMGKNAMCHKKKKIVTLQPLSYVREYFWGSAKNLDIKDIDGGENKCVALTTEGSRNYFYLTFDREYPPGAEIEFEYKRKISNGFTLNNEYVETIISTETDYVELSIIFPVDRAYQEIKAIHRHGDYAKVTNLDSKEFFMVIENGKVKVVWKIPKPILRDTYLIDFIW